MRACRRISATYDGATAAKRKERHRREVVEDSASRCLVVEIAVYHKFIALIDVCAYAPVAIGFPIVAEHLDESPQLFTSPAVAGFGLRRKAYRLALTEICDLQPADIPSWHRILVHHQQQPGYQLRSAVVRIWSGKAYHPIAARR